MNRLTEELETIKAACREKVADLEEDDDNRVLAKGLLTAIEAMESWSLVSSEGNCFANVLTILVAQWREVSHE